MLRALRVATVLILFGSLTVQSVLADEMRCAGSIVTIEGENVTVKEAMKEQQMKIEPGTKITSGGKPVMVADLKVGQRVQCVLEKRGDQVICVAMEIMGDTP